MAKAAKKCASLGPAFMISNREGNAFVDGGQVCPLF